MQNEAAHLSAEYWASEGMYVVTKPEEADHESSNISSTDWTRSGKSSTTNSPLIADRMVGFLRTMDLNSWCGMCCLMLLYEYRESGFVLTAEIKSEIIGLLRAEHYDCPR